MNWSNGAPTLWGDILRLKLIMIALNTSWNKGYIQKWNKNGWQRCWDMTLKSSTKRGSKMFSQMHSPGNVRMLKDYSMLFQSSKQIWYPKQGMNGKMMNKYRHSFKSCSRIPMPLIHLGGKMTCYGTRIDYILVRDPTSIKWHFMNSTPHQQEVT